MLEQAAGVIGAKFAPAMVGVHMRGTDKGAWGGARKVNRIVWPEEFAIAVDAALEVLRCGVEDGATEARLHQGEEEEQQQQQQEQEEAAAAAEEEEEQGGRGARRCGGCEHSLRRHQSACRRARRRGIYVATDQAAFRAFFAQRFGAHRAAPAHGDSSGGGSVRVAWSGAELSNSSAGIFNLPSPANDDQDAGGAAASAARSLEYGSADTGGGHGQGAGAGSGRRAAGSGRGYRRGLEVLVDSLVLSQVSVSSLSRTVRTCARVCVGGRGCVLALIMDTKAQLWVSLHAVGGRRASSSRRRARPLPPTPPSRTPRSPC